MPMLTEQDRALTKQSIMRHEGFSPTPVKDSRGSIAIGYGWNVIFTPMTEPQGQFMLEQHMDAKQEELLRAWPSYASCDGPRQRVLLEMSYQLGVSGLLLFRKMLHCVAAKDYEGAAQEVLHSSLATQTPARARDYAAGLRETL